jgi:4-hydroxybenzoyl-CoA reductase subunit alpha
MKTKVPDKAPLALDKVRYIGDEIAAVAADDVDIAAEALDLITVEYEILPAVFDPFEAMEPDAPQIHAHARTTLPIPVCLNGANQWISFEQCDVILKTILDSFPDSLLYGADCSVATWIRMGMLPFGLQASPTHKQELVKALGIPEQKVRVITPTLGGGFGGKRHMVEPSVAAALLSRMSRRPVKVEYTRVEEFTAARHRHPMNIHLRVGAKRNGKLVFFDAANIVDNGAYNDSGPSITLYAGHSLVTNYRIKGL